MEALIKLGEEGVCSFFFSSRRRHTRWNCDWSSDVCSSDLVPSETVTTNWRTRFVVTVSDGTVKSDAAYRALRSEERRVGKECRSRWSPYDERKTRRRVRGEVRE